MNGFIVSNIKISKQAEVNSKEFEQIECDGITIKYRPGKKFKEDKVFYQDESYIILLDGIILNAAELKKQYDVESMTELCKKLLSEKGNTFYEDFIGNFAGAVYFKEIKELIVFTNKLSSKQVFYYSENGVFVAGSLITDIAETLLCNNIKYSFNKSAAYLMLTYGYMGTDDTFVKEIKKIEAGHYIKFINGESEDLCYHRFTNYKYDLTNLREDEIIDGIDIRFRRAIKREYEKDLEGGYQYHLRSLTGGTDSRACAFVSDSLGFKNVFNYTYGVPEQADEVVARQISKHLGNNFIYLSNLPMEDEANFLTNIDDAVYKAQGQAYYFEVAQSAKERVELSSDSFGLSHGGGFSEAFLTTGYLKNPSMEKPSQPLHTYCRLLLDKCPKEHLDKYENEDIYSIYSIFFNKHNPTGRNLVNLNEETVFPGLDADLVEYCLSIPIELRKNYYIYHKWLFNKYPDAINFKLEKLNAKVNDNKVKKWWGKITRFGGVEQYFRCSKDKFPTMLRKKFQLDKKIKPSNKALMPFDYWYETSKEAQEYMEKYLNDNIQNPVIDEELRNDLLYVYENSLARPKSMVISVVAAAKLFFKEKVSE